MKRRIKSTKDEAKRDLMIRRLFVASLYMLGCNMREICAYADVERTSAYNYIEAMRVPRRGYKYKYKRNSIV